jgi:cyclophilin family peptidyl-prolyl cis-trans isomerase/HEAT repeat protein
MKGNRMLSSLLAVRVTILVSSLLLCGACASVPAVVSPVKQELSWEQKLGWMMRLEDQRVLRDPAPAVPVVLVPATRDRPALLATPPPFDLLRMLADPDRRVRRRAALAVGRSGLPEAVGGLTPLLSDEEMEVRQMAAFAMGLLRAPSARPALRDGLLDPHPIVQGRSAEALGAIGDTADAAAIATMVRGYIQGGALAGIDPDDLTYPLPPPVEAVRMGLSALATLGAYGPLSDAALERDGMPTSHWWPIASALQRVGDARSAPALLALLTSGGRYSPSFAARGLGALKSSAAVAPLMKIVRDRKAPSAVVLQSLRALTAIADETSASLALEIATDGMLDLELRVEALAAIGLVHPTGATDVLLDLLSEEAAPVRAAAMGALGRIDPDTLMIALSGLDSDSDWTVRSAHASILSSLPAERATPLLTRMLSDPDQRVVAAVLRALVKVRAPGAERLLTERLQADDEAVRAVAAAGLGELVAPVFPVLADAYRAWKDEPSYVPRAAALEAMAKIDERAAAPLLLEALKDRDWAVRVRAAELLRDSGTTEEVSERMRPAPAGRAVSESVWQWLQSPPFSPHATVETARGTIELELAVLDAPLTVAAFMDLAREGFFNGMPLHRVVLDFVVEGGDPRGDGEGGPGYTLRDEINERPFLRGTVGMTLDWNDTGGSQFFITHSPQPHLDGRHTVFGHVVDGMDVLDALRQGDIVRKVTIRDGVLEK